MNFDMLEMEVVRFADDNGLSDVKSADAALWLNSQMGNLLADEFEGDIDSIKNSVGAIVVSLIAYCDSRNINLTKCLELIVKRTKNET